MSVAVRYTEPFEQDYFAHSADDRSRIEASVSRIRLVALRWTAGAIPVQDFDPNLNIHPVSSGVYSANWELHDGRMTFALDDVDDVGYPDQIILRRVGSHAIFRNP